MQLFKELASIHAPSGSEYPLKEFILDYIANHSHNWKQQPKIYQGEELQDCLVLVFGKPRTAVFAHMDSVGFTVQYNQRLVKIGKPKTYDGISLIGEDSQGEVECRLKLKQDNDEDSPELLYEADRNIDPGTTLTFKPNYREQENFIQTPYVDNRAGIYNALKLAETLENGILCFSCWEEHGGGSVGYLGRFIYENFGVRQALISDITWATEDIHHGMGVAISMRDSGIPRRLFVEKVLELADKSGIPYQKEVEGAGGSDGIELQKSPYPFDWCFIGAGESNVHSPDEKIHKKDLENMTQMYQLLMQKL